VRDCAERIEENQVMPSRPSAALIAECECGTRYFGRQGLSRPRRLRCCVQPQMSTDASLAILISERVQPDDIVGGRSWSSSPMNYCARSCCYAPRIKRAKKRVALAVRRSIGNPTLCVIVRVVARRSIEHASSLGAHVDRCGLQRRVAQNRLHDVGRHLARDGARTERMSERMRGCVGQL
jgi:hypothetical protein